VGDFTAQAGDLFALNSLYDAGGGVFAEGAFYRVAMRDDPSGTGGGRLILNGEDVTGRTEFTGLEFNALQFLAGPAGSAQDLLVVARTARADGSGGLTGIVDSPAVEITARVTGTRSINAMGALRSPEETSSGFDRIVRDAEVYGTSSAPILSTPIRPDDPVLSAGALSAAVGAYRATGGVMATGALDLTALFGSALGGSRIGNPAATAELTRLSGLVTLLGGSSVGGVRSAGTDLSRQSQVAVQAYLRTLP
jgi:hypothetical protein